jgi:hypothetical protein
MRRLLLSLAGIALLALSAAALAGAAGKARPGFLVVHKAQGDGGLFGSPVVTVVVQGFVLGRASQEARVDVYQLPSVHGGGGPQASGVDVLKTTVHWRKFTGTRFSGSSFRFSAIGGAFRVVIRGSGVSLFAGGRGSVTLEGSSVYRNKDGFFAIDGGAFRSLPAKAHTFPIGGG